MNQDDGIWRGVLLHVDEIPQRELELVHAVDERHVDTPAAQLGQHVMGGEKVIAGFGMDALQRPRRLFQLDHRH